VRHQHSKEEIQEILKLGNGMILLQTNGRYS